jgi:hypothetical protein
MALKIAGDVTYYSFDLAFSKGFFGSRKVVAF